MSGMTFIVPGPPVAKQRPRRAPAGNWYTPARTKRYEELVAWSAKAAGIVLEEGVQYVLRLELHLSAYHGDRDNILKSVMDGLNRLGDDWDDRQVVEATVVTVPVRDGSEEKAVVTIRPKGTGWAETLEEQ